MNASSFVFKYPGGAGAGPREWCVRGQAPKVGFEGETTKEKARRSSAPLFLSRQPQLMCVGLSHRGDLLGQTMWPFEPVVRFADWLCHG